LPAEASEVSWPSAVKSGVMSPTDSAGALALALAEDEALVAGALVGLVAALVLELLELQAAMRRAALTPAAASPALFVALFVT